MEDINKFYPEYNGYEGDNYSERKDIKWVRKSRFTFMGGWDFILDGALNETDLKIITDELTGIETETTGSKCVGCTTHLKLIVHKCVVCSAPYCSDCFSFIIQNPDSPCLKIGTDQHRLRF